MSQEWYVQADGEILGPLDSEGLQFAVDQGAVQRDTLIRLGERGSWNPAGSIAGIFPTSEPVPVFMPKARQPERMVPASQVAPQVAVSVARVRKGWCPQCNATTVQGVRPVSHLLHFVLSIATGGLWIIVWIAAACSQSIDCTVCGSQGYSSEGDYRLRCLLWRAFEVAATAVIVLVFVAIIIAMFRS